MALKSALEICPITLPLAPPFFLPRSTVSRTSQEENTLSGGFNLEWLFLGAGRETEELVLA